MESLWNFELFETEEVKETYRGILEEQAKYFNESSDLANLFVESGYYDNEFFDILGLVSKDGVYKIRILTVAYDLHLNKVTLRPNEELASLLKSKYIYPWLGNLDYIIIKDMESYKSLLHNIFTSQYMINLMKNLKRIMGGGISLEKKYTGGN